MINYAHGGHTQYFKDIHYDRIHRLNYCSLK
jgi:hypothetical protein